MVKVDATHIGWGIFKIGGKLYTVGYYEEYGLESNGNECFLVGLDTPEEIPVKEIIRDEETDWANGFVLNI
jgi:hypothetical protein